jgi:uncharacterized protein (TIGR02271 family)
MSRWINALYDTRAEAEVARARLVSEMGIERTSILSKTNESELSKLDLSAADREKYSDGLRGGAVLLTAEAKGQKDEVRILRILEEAARDGGPGPAFFRDGAPGVRPVEEQRIPLVEEELRIGKQEVARGGARVKSHVREVPAEADVTLKQERLGFERRPDGKTLSDADLHSGGLLKPRVVEISEMREEAVITKEAFVREEVVVTKTVEERVETIRDTVRRTEVDVDEFGAGGRPR